jgi:hypothetical protein
MCKGHKGTSEFPLGSNINSKTLSELACVSGSHARLVLVEMSIEIIECSYYGDMLQTGGNRDISYEYMIFKIDLRSSRFYILRHRNEMKMLFI